MFPFTTECFIAKSATNEVHWVVVVPDVVAVLSELKDWLNL